MPERPKRFQDRVMTWALGACFSALIASAGWNVALTVQAYKTALAIQAEFNGKMVNEIANIRSWFDNYRAIVDDMRVSIAVLSGRRASDGTDGAAP